MGCVRKLCVEGEDMNKTSAIQTGDYIRIIHMDGEPQYAGREGVVTHVDAIGQIHGTWGGCAIIPDKDSYEVIGKSKGVEGKTITIPKWTYQESEDPE